MLPDEVIKKLELVEGDAYEDIFRAASPEVAEQLQLKIAHFGSARARLMGALDATLFNAVVGVGLMEPATEQLLDDIIDFYAPYGVRFMVQPSPLAQPPQLVEWLEARGFRFRDEWVKMYRGVASPPAVATDLQIREVRPEQAQAFAETALKGFQLPLDMPALLSLIAEGVGREGWQHYLAYDRDTPVATGGLYLKDRAGWCGYGSTLAQYRRRGAQNAMFARRIADAAELGCGWLTTETDTETADCPSPSYRNMVRAGFQLAYNRPNYVWSPSGGDNN